MADSWKASLLPAVSTSGMAGSCWLNKFESVFFGFYQEGENLRIFFLYPL
jgi:hypothetical protein